jgi:hypothetical protein
MFTETFVIFQRQMRILIRNPVWVFFGLTQPIGSAGEGQEHVVQSRTVDGDRRRAEPGGVEAAQQWSDSAVVDRDQQRRFGHDDFAHRDGPAYHCFGTRTCVGIRQADSGLRSSSRRACQSVTTIVTIDYL